MKKFEQKTMIIYILIILYILFTHLIDYRPYNNLFINLISPLFFLILFLICLPISNQPKSKYKTIKMQTIFIIISTYLILYFVSGIVVGYTRSIYDHSLLGIIKNMWTYLVPIIFIEYIRTTLVNTNKNKLHYILITILFTLVTVNIKTILLKSDYSTIFKDFSSIVIPTLTSNILLTYLSISCGYYGNLFYRIPQILVSIILPILPNLNWYYTSVLGVLLPLFIYAYIKNINTKIESHYEKKKAQTKSRLKLLYITIPIFILVLFVAGFLKYKPVAIMSNSMKPIFNRGDVVIVEKVTKKNIENLKKYDIIEYILDGTIVAHRIINIEEHNDGTVLYTTKGDNNNLFDTKKVKRNQVKGKVKFKIPKIGYPSVYLSEFLNKKKNVGVETGKP